MAVTSTISSVVKDMESFLKSQGNPIGDHVGFLDKFEKYIHIEEEVTLSKNIFILNSLGPKNEKSNSPIYCQQKETRIFISPLIWAAGGGLGDVVSMILDVTKVDGNFRPDVAPDQGPITALFLALCYGHAKIAKALLEVGAKPEASFSVNALHAAARGGLLSIIRLLVDVYGVDPNVEDHDGATPVFYALLLPKKEAFDTISLLYSLGARQDSRTADHDWSLQDIAEAMGRGRLILKLERGDTLARIYHEWRIRILISCILWRVIANEMLFYL